MASAKKVFSNIGAGFSRLFHSTPFGERKNEFQNEREQSLPYCNQVYKFSQNENEMYDLPDQESNIQTQFVNSDIGPITGNTQNYG